MSLERPVRAGWSNRPPGSFFCTGRRSRESIGRDGNCGTEFNPNPPAPDGSPELQCSSSLLEFRCSAPSGLIFTGDRNDGKQITLSLIIDRSKFQATTENALQVTGSYQEGRGGPRRSIVGELRLTTAGTEQGHEVSGDINLRIMETHGGVFQPQPSAGGFQGPGSVNAPRSYGQAQPLTLLKALDADRDGTISAAEIEQAAAALKLLDRNRDGKLSDDELQDPRK
ncbi:MAG: hypothetical protein WCJ09_16760 [Planctomycetota bacterium]